MVQGTTKGRQVKASSNTRHAHKAAANTKKGRRNVAPKKVTAIKQASIHKVSLSPDLPVPIFPTPLARFVLSTKIAVQALSAKINKSVEQQMVNAASSGKLTIMKNGGTAER
jgi:Protein of unknown function (DUF2462)